MRLRARWCSRALLVGAILFLSGISSQVQAQDQQHVVPLNQLKKDAAQPAETRRADEAVVKNFLSTEPAQKALKSANLDLQKVDTAVSRLSDEDLAKLAEKSRQAQTDFAAGRLSDRDLLWIILIIVAVLIIALALR